MYTISQVRDQFDESVNDWIAVRKVIVLRSSSLPGRDSRVPRSFCFYDIQYSSLHVWSRNLKIGNGCCQRILRTRTSQCGRALHLSHLSQFWATAFNQTLDKSRRYRWAQGKHIPTYHPLRLHHLDEIEPHIQAYSCYPRVMILKPGKDS